MAMSKCKECKAEVSTKAKTCPSCGISNPGVSGKDLAVGLGAMVVVILFVVAACSPDDEPSEKAANEPVEPSEQAQSELQQAEACRADLQCWGQKNWASATNRCQREIERNAKYQVKWTDEYPDVKLSRRGWLNQEEGTLTYYGDRVQFANAYGAFENYTYRCDYDPSDKTVLNVQLDSGRL